MKTLEQFSDLIFEGNLDAEEKITITDLKHNKYQKTLFELILKNPNFPSNLSLTIKYNLRGNSITHTIANALSSENCGKDGISIALPLHRLGPNHADILAGSIRCNKYPKHFRLSLQNNNIGNQGLNKFADVLRACKTGFELNLNDNKISYNGFYAFAYKLTRGYPEGMRIDLGYNYIGNKGLQAFLDVIKSRRHGLYLGLESSNISNKGVFSLAKLLREGAFHCGFEINLGQNLVNQHGIMALIQAVNTGNGPPNLGLSLDGCYFESRLNAALQTAISRHNQRRNIYIGLTLFQPGSIFNEIPMELVLAILNLAGVSPLVCEPEYFAKRPTLPKCKFLDYVESAISKPSTLSL